MRNGFVSNSSSSSFIIGVGKIKPEFVEDIKTLANEYKYDMEVVTSEDLKQRHKGQVKRYEEMLAKGDIHAKWFKPSNFNKVKVSSFNDDYVSVPFEENSTYMIYKFYGNEGDYTFGEDECDYDIDMDFFGEKQQAVVELFKSDKFEEEVKWNYGAGRNG